MEDKHFSIEYSIAVINHVIEKAKTMNETQKDIAEYLGISAPNITHLKNGEQNIGPTKFKLLVSKYGMPKQEPGIYLEPMLYETVEDYLNALPERNKAFYVDALVRAFSSNDIVKSITRCVSEQVLKDNSTDEIWGIQISSLMQNCPASKIPEVIEWINEKLKLEETKQWFDEMNVLEIPEDARDVWRSVPRIKNYGWKKSMITERDHLIIFLLCELYFNHPEHYGLPAPRQYENTHLKKHPVNLTGNQILHFTSGETEHYKSKALTFLKSQARTEDHGGSRVQAHSGIVMADELKMLAKLSFTKVTCRLFMNKDMKYRFHIQEERDGKLVDVVIKHVPQDKIIDVYNTLASHFNVEQEKEFELRKNIAAAGGYIPGVEVL